MKMSASEKKANRDTYDISSIKRVTREFLEVSRCCRAKHRQRNIEKRAAGANSFFFLLIYNLPTILFFYKNVFDKTIKAEICKT